MRRLGLLTALCGILVACGGTSSKSVVLRAEGPSGKAVYLQLTGSPEATAIVYALQGMETPRPMTHDLFKTVLDDLAVTLEKVEITELHDGTFYAEIELDRAGTKSRISSRPSDAIALAVRYGGAIPIFADEAVLEEAGVLFEADEEEQEVAQFREFLDNVTPEDFAQ